MFRELLNLLKSSSALPTDERRETMRLRCHVNVLLRVDDLLYFATVVDVTVTGLCLEVDKPIKPEQIVSLARDDFGHPWQGQVLWCKSRKKAKGYRVGVQYPTDPEMLRASWLQPALRQAGFEAEVPGEKRKLLRVPGRVACEIKGLTGDTCGKGEMLDLSLGGAMVECDIELPENLTVAFETVPLGGLAPLKGVAKVTSCQAGDAGKWRCGLRFTESVPDDVRKTMASMLTSR